MRRTRTRMLFALTTVVSIVWFKNHPAIRFQPGPDPASMTFSEMTANVLVASIVAVAAVVAVSSLGRAMGWWKDE
jgi:hypothetical protein